MHKTKAGPDTLVKNYISSKIELIVLVQLSFIKVDLRQN